VAVYHSTNAYIFIENISRFLLGMFILFKNLIKHCLHTRENLFHFYMACSMFMHILDE